MQKDVYFESLERQFSKNPKVSGKVFDLGPADANRTLIKTHAFSRSAARVDAALARKFIQ